jgi:hypothetical protein
MLISKIFDEAICSKKLWVYMRQICLTICVCLLTITLAGCNESKILTTLAIDISKSNIENLTEHKLLEDICKATTAKLTGIDELTITRFNSNPTPNLLDTTIQKPNSQQWQEYGEVNCPTLFQDQTSLNAPPGTDIRKPWLSFYKGYSERMNLHKNSNSSSVSSSVKSIEVFIALINSLEPVSQSREEFSKLEEFQSSIQKFIDDGNFILIYVSNQADRENLAKDLEDIANPLKRLMFLDREYKPKIEAVFTEARTKP